LFGRTQFEPPLTLYLDQSKSGSSTVSNMCFSYNNAWIFRTYTYSKPIHTNRNSKL